jgi:hypothetical protein
MNALAPIAPKLSRLIPRLASNHDGEVVATARAIGKILKSANLDFHDLAGSLDPSPNQHVARAERGCPRNGPPTFSANRHAWAEMLRKSIDADILTDWEQQFALTIVGRLSSYTFRPSAKQQAIAAEIIAKGWAHGVRP